MLTNFTTISKRLLRMRELREMERSGAMGYLPKKEAIRLRHEAEKLERNLGGIQDLERLPDAIFVVDTKKEHIAVNEARKLGIPVIAIVDTNCDPDEVDFVIPGNDDAIRAVSLVTRIVSNALEDGRGMAKDDLVKLAAGKGAAEVVAEAVPEVSPERAAEIAATTVFEPDPAPSTEPEVVAEGPAEEPVADAPPNPEDDSSKEASG
jgi:small subunit ribosomal protein S2